MIRAVARRARNRLLLMAARGSLEVFSFYPLEIRMLRSQQFDWLRERTAEPSSHQPGLPEGSRVILGSAAVVDGSQSADDYLNWVQAQQLPAVYYPHRRETADLLHRVGLIEGLTISVLGLPIELVLAASRDLRIASQPSSALTTLGIILSGRDCVLPATDTGNAVPATRSGRSLVSAGELS